MFGAIKNAHRISTMGAKWVRVTSIDPGDKGQVLDLASSYIRTLSLSPEDAWVIAIVNWISGMPWPEEKCMLSRGLLKFLDAYDNKRPISPEVIEAARLAAHAVVDGV